MNSPTGKNPIWVLYLVPRFEEKAHGEASRKSSQAEFIQLWETAEERLQRCSSRGWISIRGGMYLETL